jgi:hypothetical protein
MLTMIQVPPSNPIWGALAPFAQYFEALGRVLEVCATYYSWCAGCAAGVVLVLLTGLVLKEARSGDGEQAGGRAHQEEAGGVSTPLAADDKHTRLRP